VAHELVGLSASFGPGAVFIFLNFKSSHEDV
jgi:hypothetical protein